MTTDPADPHRREGNWSRSDEPANSGTAPEKRRRQVARSICPYCGVGCGQLVYHKDEKLISIEGDPQSPISRGHLCPKGADTYELHTHPGRLKKGKYRAPYSRTWQEIGLQGAMNMVADRLWDTRDRTLRRDVTANLSCRPRLSRILAVRRSTSKKTI
jgi:formate dehydrogenase major subunit